jgi:hypothetical protein
MPTIAQCANRMLDVHARILRGESFFRGYATAAKTLRRWGAMSGREVTARGRELLDAWNARHGGGRSVSP